MKAVQRSNEEDDKEELLQNIKGTDVAHYYQYVTLLKKEKNRIENEMTRARDHIDGYMDWVK